MLSRSDRVHAVASAHRAPGQPLLARALLTVSLAGPGVQLMLVLLNRPEHVAELAPRLLAYTTYGVVGYVIAVGRPSNRIGQLLMAIGLGVSAQAIIATLWIGSPQLTVYGLGLLDPTAAVAGVAADAYAAIAVALIGLWFFVVWLFPDGRLPSARWRIMAWLIAIDVVGIGVLDQLFIRPGPVDAPNPLFAIGQQLLAVAGPLARFLGGVFFLAVGVVFFGVLASPIWRWWRGIGSQRSQLKWFALAAFAIVVIALRFGSASFEPALALLPAAIGIAIVRDRLFDIDFVINRVALYGIVALLLVAALELVAVLVERVLGPSLREQAVIIQPLAAVATVPLFRPLERRVRPIVDRFLPVTERLTLLFTDIVGSTEVLGEMGDARWRDLLGRYNARVRGELREHRGTEVNTTGDGFFATFREPLAAARCALGLVPATDDLTLHTRVGLHVGDCDTRGEQPIGINVHLAARVMSAADGDTVLASESCRDALAGTSLVFEPLGSRSLKGIPGQVYLYRIKPGTS